MYGSSIEEGENSKRIVKVEERDYTFYFKYFWVYNTDWQTEYSSKEDIKYDSDSAVYSPINSLNFSETVFIETEKDIWEWHRDYDDINNPKEIRKRSTNTWVLPFNCVEGIAANYKVKHAIVAVVEFGLKKPAPIIETYFSCNWK